MEESPILQNISVEKICDETSGCSHNEVPAESNVPANEESMQVDDEVKIVNDCMNQECSSECEVIFENGCPKCLCTQIENKSIAKSGSDENH